MPANALDCYVGLFDNCKPTIDAIDVIWVNVSCTDLMSSEKFPN